MMDVTQEELSKAIAAWLKVTFEYIKSPLSVQFDSASEWLMDHIKAQRLGKNSAFELDTYNRLHYSRIH